MADVSIRSNDLRQLAKDLQTASSAKELRGQFSAKVSAALDPVVVEVKAAFLAGPSKGHSSWGGVRKREPGLRTMLSGATQMQVSTSGKQAGVRVKVAGSRMPSGYRGLPKAVEGHSRWRHPIYGNREVWVGQQSRPTVDPIMERHLPRVDAAVKRAADEIRRKLERGSQ